MLDAFKSMFIRLLVLLLVNASLIAQAPQPASRIGRVLEGAYHQIGKTTIYDGTYRRLPFPGGDVPLERGVCTDVIVRAYRHAGLDLQALVNQDMTRSFAAYPQLWGLSKPDSNMMCCSPIRLPATIDMTPEAPDRNLASIRPSFIVKDLQASISYYRDRLGFQLDFQGPDDGPFWAGVSRDGIGIMLKAVGTDVPPIPNHTRREWGPSDADIYSMDPEALFDEFSRRGASFVKKLSFIEDGLWGFTVIDADGYVLRFFCLRNE